MDTDHAPPPVEAGLSAEEHAEALKRQDKLASGSVADTTDEALPKVQSDKGE